MNRPLSNSFPMLKHPDQTVKRLDRFVEKLEATLIEGKEPLRLAVSRDPGIVDEASARRATFTEVEKGFRWGPIWSTAWFRVTGRVPDNWQRENVLAVIGLGAETTIWKDNAPREGLDRHHRYLHLETGPEIDLIAEAYAPNPTVHDRIKPAEPPAEPCEVGEAFLFLPDPRIWSYTYDFKVALSLLHQLPRDEPRFGRLLYAMNESINVCLRDGYESAADVLRNEWNQPVNASAHLISAIGHAHIDTAWLWPLSITRKKCAHTFATATRYMELYPEYKFACSQAVQYDWMRESYPALFERIKERARAGQWEPTGSMWVEADCNLASGESLVRQFLYGKRFFLENFGVETTDMWLPDVFGYAASLPQIMKLAGIDSFMTQKISWSMINRFPHHTFLWKGIDGTEVFSHFLPADDYNASMTPKQLVYSVKNFKDHGRANRSLYVYGYGDGGGGPTIEMIENAARMRDIEGLPKVELECVRDFFIKAKEDARDLPVWSGELYLECHRGTYTTQAANKRHNRKCELKLREVEMLCATQLPAREYPRAELDEAWKLVLLNQFHDIIPGSSVNIVYRDSDKDYARVHEILDGLRDRVLTSSPGDYVTAFLAYPGVPAVCEVEYAGQLPASVAWGEGIPSPAQDLGDGKMLVRAPEIDIGFTYGKLSSEAGVAPSVSATDRSLENEYLKVMLDDTGNIASMMMKATGQEVVSEGRTVNQFQFFDDTPNDWDAWDIDVFASETMTPVAGLESIEIVERGPVRAAFQIARKVGDGSKITQHVRLAAGCPYIEFDTHVDWYEERKMLKVAFPVRVNSDHATYDIQFGHLRRTNHFNTSWDIGKFEVCAHKWVDLSEGGWGAALINDCKYGHDILGDTMRLTLLRSPKAPDPEADMGSHHFTYWLYPHLGGFRNAWVPTGPSLASLAAYSVLGAAGHAQPDIEKLEVPVVDLANYLNSPVRCLTASIPAGQRALVAAEAEPFGPKLVLEALKRAEDSDAIVVRMYEAHNARGRAVIRFGFAVTTCQRCDLLEREQEALQVRDGAVELEIRPFEIISLKLS